MVTSQATMMVETPRCVFCEKKGWIKVSIAGYNAWKKGAFIQTAMPELTPGEREQLINGTHDRCFDRNIPDE